MDDRGFYCEHCGEKLPPGSKFCSKCGEAVSDYVNEMGDVSASGYAQAEAAAGTRSKGPHSLLKWLILAVVIVVVVILLIVFLVSPGSVKLNKYMTIESSGVDGFGTVLCNFDYDAFYSDYAGKIETDATNILSSQDSDFSDPVEMLYSKCVGWTVAYPDDSIKDGSLSNGDKIVVEWNCDDAAVKEYFNKRLRYSNINYRVKGLTEAEGINVFDYIDVNFTGEDSMGEVYIEVLPSGEDFGISEGDFAVFPSSNLTNGTTITVSFNENAAEKLEQTKDVVPIETEKVYTVEGLENSTTPSAESSKGTGNTGNSGTTGVTGNTADTGEVGEAGSDEYLCSYSSERLITEADLSAIRAAGNYGSLPAGRSLEQMIINEIYAKHGYRFTTPEIQFYFEQKAWYNEIGTYESDMSVVWDRLSSIEKQNVDYLDSL